MASVPQTIAPRECWWVKLDGVESTKKRLSVVIRIEPDFIQVIYGQSSPDPNVGNVEFIAGTKEANVLGCHQDTYFRETNVEFVKRVRFQNKAGACMPMKFVALMKLVESAALRVAAKTTAQPASAQSNQIDGDKASEGDEPSPK